MRTGQEVGVARQRTTGAAAFHSSGERNALLLLLQLLGLLLLCSGLGLLLGLHGGQLLPKVLHGRALPQLLLLLVEVRLPQRCLLVQLQTLKGLT